MEENARENKQEDQHCLSAVEEKLVNPGEGNWPVAGIIIEPIQSEGGDHEASPEFFQSLQKLCAKHGVALIIDEVQTGGGSTGKWWAHEYFNLPHSPDVVTFSKKMQFGGYYHGKDFRPSHAYRVFNTWMGDPARLLLLEGVLQEVKKSKLIDLANKTGAILEKGLNDIRTELPHLVSATRGRGTFRAFDMPDMKSRDKLVSDMKQLGIMVGACGKNTIRLRPALIFTEKHANIFLDRLKQALRKM